MKRIMQIGLAVVGLILIFSVVLGVISGSSRDIDDEFDFGETKITTTTYETTITGPETTEVITTTKEVTTTEPPETVTEPPGTIPPTTTPPGVKPLLYDGKVAVTGEFGLYDAGGNPIKVYPMAFMGEDQIIAYYEARVDKIEILGGSGLDPESWVLYIRTKVWASQDGEWVAEDVIITDDIQIYMSDMQFMHGYGIDGIVTQPNTAWGVLDLSDHWYGYYNRENVPKKAIQHVNIDDVFIEAGIPRACELVTAPVYGGEPGYFQKTTVKFLFEVFVECHDQAGKWYSAAKDPHELQIDIVEEALRACPMTASVIGIGAGGGMGRWFLVLVIIIGGYVLYRRKDDL